MQLLDLPVELLFKILGNLGSKYFHSSVSCLTVSKSWHRVAQKVFNSQLRLTERNLKPFVDRIWSDGPASRLAVEVKDVEFAIIQVQDMRQIFDQADSDVNLIEDLGLAVAGWGGRWGYQHDSKWSAELVRYLSALHRFLGECSVLKTFRIQVNTDYRRSLPNVPRKGLLTAQMMSRLLDLKSLTSLDLDTFGLSHIDHELSKKELDSSDEHLCHCVSMLLPQLRHLRLRLYFICPRALELPKGCSTPLRKASVTMSLFLQEWSEERSEELTVFGRGCDAKDPFEPFANARESVRKEFEVLSWRAPALREATMEWHVFPKGILQTLDVLTGKLSHRNVSMHKNINEHLQVRDYFSVGPA